MKDQAGLYKKFEVSRTDGEELPPEAAFLVLRLDEHGDEEDQKETQAARWAALQYAIQTGNQTLLKDLQQHYSCPSPPRKNIPADEKLEQYGTAGWVRARDVRLVRLGENLNAPSAVIVTTLGDKLSQPCSNLADAEALVSKWGEQIRRRLTGKDA